MDMLGYERGINYSNDNDNRNRLLQRSVQINNMNNLANFNVVEKGISNNYNTTEKTQEGISSQKSQTKGQEGAGEFLGDVRNVYKGVKAVNKIKDDVKGAIMGGRRAQFLSEVGGATRDTTSGVGSLWTPGEDENALDDIVDVPVYAGGSATATADTVSQASRGAGLISDVSSGTSAIAQTSNLGDIAQDVSRAGGSLGEAGQRAFTGTRDVIQAGQELAGAVRSGDVGGALGSISDGVNSISKVSGALDSLGKAGEGLGVISAGGDVLDDLNGGFAKMNTAEKVGNITGIGAGAIQLTSLASSFEGAGAMLDATGIGAEIGVGLGIAGAVVGGISALSDYIGGKEKQKTQLPASQVAKAPTPQSNPGASISSTQSGNVGLSGYN